MPPTRRTTSRISGAVAAMLLLRKLMASARRMTPSWESSMMLRSLARASPACPAEMPKATPTRAASWVKRMISCRGMPDWPAAAAISVSSRAVMGMVRVRAKSWDCRAFRAGRGPSITLRTSAKASSKSIAARVARTRGAARAVPAARVERPAPRRSWARLTLSVRAWRRWRFWAILAVGPLMRSASSIITWRR